MAVSGLFVLGIFLVIAGLLLAVTGVAIVIHRATYTRRANRRLAEHAAGKTGKKGMVSPFQVLMTVLGVFAVLFVGVILFGMVMVLMFRFNTNSGTNAPSSPGLRFDAVSNPDDSLLAPYSPEDEIAGYTRFVQESGDITFVYYVSRDPGGQFPEMLVYAGYTGSEDYYRMEYETNIQSGSGVGSGGGWDADGERSFWFAAQLDKDPTATISLSVYLLSKESAERVLNEHCMPGELAEVSANLTLNMDTMLNLAMEQAPIVTTETVS